MNIIANHRSSKFIIYSNSKSVLQALQSKNSSIPLITRLLDKMNTLSKNNSIILTWIPNHIGIQGNERADRDTIGEWPAGYRRNRKEVTISWLRIGHTYITHSHLLKGEDSPVCLTCKVPLTVKHILINCDRFRWICPKHYQTNNLKNLFKNSKPEEILSFLKEINLFIKI